MSQRVEEMFRQREIVNIDKRITILIVRDAFVMASRRYIVARYEKKQTSKFARRKAKNVPILWLFFARNWLFSHFIIYTHIRT